MKMLENRLYPPSTGLTGWGRKKSGNRAVEVAMKSGLKFQLYEDGFLRSIGRDDEALSVIVDDEGIYYDAFKPSRLEKLVRRALSTAESMRARDLITHWRAICVSKYNAEREFKGEFYEPYVLVIDQVAGDLSIQYGRANAESFQRALNAALSENPNATIVVKTHPDLHTREKAGHFDLVDLVANEHVRIVAEACHPVRLIEGAFSVYVVTSQVGFEALIRGKPVRCFGMPFYAGWGLTQDELPAPDRRKKVTLEQLVHAALVEYPRYLNPEKNERCEVETVMDYIGLQRQMRFRFPPSVYAIGFSAWKKPLMKLFFQGSDVIFVRCAADIPDGETAVVWGRKEPDGLPKGGPVLRVEDGFLRSSGLGGDLIRPLSWVVDEVGIYYDATRPSRLENILQEQDFDEDLLVRARKLRNQIVDAGIGKYNLRSEEWVRPENIDRVILVPGQVENDASIRYGARKGASNLGLLKLVREQNPDAFLVYKPHPDVVAGLRRKGQNEQSVRQWCDAVIESGDVVPLFRQVDEVHTLTSLTGFEALLRGVKVTCHGSPFYAGWGLTTDLHPVTRRVRKLKLDELVAGALILYPTYISRVTDAFTTPERAVEELVEWRKIGPSRMPLWRKGWRQIARIWAASGIRRNA